MEELSLEEQKAGLEKVVEHSAIKDFRNRVQEFTKILNQQPDPRKVKKKDGYQYIPISVIEKELDRLYFGGVQYEIIGFQQVFNEILVHARIKVFHPVYQTWLHYDGAGSAVIQQNANTNVIDFHQNKKANAMQLAFPKAKAEAIKNAAKGIGKRFGADINREFEDEYVPLDLGIRVKVTEGSDVWKGLIQSLVDGITIQEIEKKVELTDEQREKLLSEAI